MARHGDWKVYVLVGRKSVTYTGVTARPLEVRVREHAKRPGGPWRVVLTVDGVSRQTAERVEAALKRLGGVDAKLAYAAKSGLRVTTNF